MTEFSQETADTANLHISPGIHHEVPLALVQHEFAVVFVAVSTLKGVLVAGDGELQVVGGLVHLAQSHVTCITIQSKTSGDYNCDKLEIIGQQGREEGGGVYVRPWSIFRKIVLA